MTKPFNELTPKEKALITWQDIQRRKEKKLLKMKQIEGFEKSEQYVISHYSYNVALDKLALNHRYGRK